MDLNLTESIFKLKAPYDNPFQGEDLKLLFVCSAGILRSATAANLFAKKGYNTRSCGTHAYALVPLSKNLIYWADKIVFVNGENYRYATNSFKEESDLLYAKSFVLNIQDCFQYNDPELIRLLEERVVI